MQPRIRKPVFVHLGNIEVDLERKSKTTKTERYAKRFPSVKFIGIDLNPHKSRQRNYRQITGEFLTELKKLRNGTVSSISSDCTLGHYGIETPKKDPRQYTVEVICTAFKKLKPGGKLHILISEGSTSASILQGIRQPGLDWQKVIVRAATEAEKNRTFWAKNLTKKWDHKLLQITAEK